MSSVTAPERVSLGVSSSTPASRSSSKRISESSCSRIAAVTGSLCIGTPAVGTAFADNLCIGASGGVLEAGGLGACRLGLGLALSSFLLRDRVQLFFQRGKALQDFVR